ncbi:nitric oxide synthase-interacting protein isoform X1 [Camarhynchus parvulus]|uniref:nitric oxide synthase-interacting protein isoform X1 n=1 Tax=Geospiza parvula TaxID=87175 RepID=UPI001237DB5B|nr:nitric oxide synthase-interacting protein isoform X1 [Camarhynchus parvulus]XP_030826772.1 nitric oxide synthase-interacting protein isoform X2 [Camarhynchus parvulus]XP_030826773.1 nitric oxide synthase-interacting protein isoform X1 [Camarhynchus parvulus]XP_030826774.1 nitric oxide synthase-interacting protein isoform X1 [Camarhynchus parvulus]
MTRHGKNCTAGAVYSYHERKKDTAASGYGTQRVRVGRDAIKDFDCCCLSLQPCRDPVVTPDGFLYEREAIVSYLLHQKTKIARETKAWERQQAERRRQREQQRGEGAAKALRGFLEAETPLGKGGTETPGGSGAPGPLPSFWIPSLTPEAAAESLARPERAVRCPMSGRKLRLAQLVSVHFTPAERGLSPGQLLAREPSDRYVCALTGDPLGNATPCAVLRPSGSVVTLAAVDRLVRPDMRDPLSGAELSDSDVITLQRGGTGFAGAGVSLEAKKSRPVMQA